MRLFPALLTTLLRRGGVLNGEVERVWETQRFEGYADAIVRLKLA